MKKRTVKKRWKEWLKRVKKCDYCQRIDEYAKFCKNYFANPSFRKEAQKMGFTPEIVYLDLFSV